MKKIYFILTDAGTALGKIIKFKTRKKYTHVSISLDKDLKKMYSFSRINPYICFLGGFMHERLNVGCFKRFKNTEAKICYIEITDYQYEKLQEQIMYFEANRNKYKFNVLGLAYIFINKEIHRENYFYCAEFIKYVLKKSNVNIQLPNMPRPEDFEQLKNSRVIYIGLLNQYKSIESTDFEAMKVS